MLLALSRAVLRVPQTPTLRVAARSHLAQAFSHIVDELGASAAAKLRAHVAQQ